MRENVGLGSEVTIYGRKKLGGRRSPCREKTKHTGEVLPQAIWDFAKAFLCLVEKRDPYTCYHQQEVAKIATAIARQLGLSREQLDGLRLAAILHDIGKMVIPLDILNKPGSLSDIEYELVKTHPQVAYEILQEIEFPWPVASIILQHHERYDGSGYGQGLIGDQILIEARILAVADVVNAMASHRPYRPSLGMCRALGEILDYRGTLYDPQVVEACVRVLA